MNDEDIKAKIKDAYREGYSDGLEKGQEERAQKDEIIRILLDKIGVLIMNMEKIRELACVRRI